MQSSNTSRIPLFYYVNPIKFGNTAGLGIILGATFYMAKTRSLLILPEKTYYFTLILLVIHLLLYTLVLGTFFYQLVFAIPRYYNEKLIPHQHQWIFERSVQFMFGLCVGGFLIQFWNQMMTSSTCILEGYCATPTFMRKVAELKVKACAKEAGNCSNFFYNFPALFQTLRTVFAALLAIFIWESQYHPLEISIRVINSSSKINGSPPTLNKKKNV